jgi:hypothetical protein
MILEAVLLFGRPFLQVTKDDLKTTLLLQGTGGCCLSYWSRPSHVAVPRQGWAKPPAHALAS